MSVEAIKNIIAGAASTAQSSTALTQLGDRAIMRCVSDVVAEHIRWLWFGRVAIGKLTLIAGDPGLGKSQLTAFMAAKVSTGGAWPNNGGTAPIGSVIMFSCEDDIADTIRPRLEAVDADLSRIHVVEAVEEKGKRRGFNMVDDIPKLEKLLQENKDIILIFIDPITAYMGEANGHNTGDVRVALAPLQDLASRYNVAVVAISHLNKNGGNGKAINAVTGSTAYVAAARAAFLVAKDPNDESRRYLLQLKNNLANAAGLSFTIQSKLLPNGIEAPLTVFNNEVVNINADEILGVSIAESSGNSVAHAAEEFLYEELKNGAVPTNELFARAKEVSISVSTLRRAQKRIGIVAAKGGYQGQWVWQYPFASLGKDSSQNPSKITTTSIDTQPHDMGIFEQARSSLESDKEDVS